MTDIIEESNTESARRLVTIQTISSLERIEGKDRIELAQVMGWWCIVKKGEFAVGDRCVFHEPDTVVNTAIPAYAFLAARAKTDGKHRIRTMRMGGVLSQGLALPMSILPQEFHYSMYQDVTQDLQCEKWNPQSDHGQAMKSCPAARRPWPMYAPPKTDEIRLQSALGVVTEFENTPAYLTIKLDGSSMTLMNVEGHVQLCSRNYEILMEEDVDGTFTRAVRELGLAEKLPYGYAVQGELCGPGIQKNHMNFDKLEYFVFNVFSYLDEDGNMKENKKPRLLGYTEWLAFCRQYGFDNVPCLNDDFKFCTTDPVQGVYKELVGSTYSGGFPMEGYVIRPRQVKASKYVSPWLSVKVINPEFEIAVG